MADPGVDGLALLDRQLQARQPLPALTPNRSEHGGLPCSRRCSTAWISFLARDRERTSCSRRASRRRRTRQRSSGIQTASSSPRHSRLASVRASSRSVFARALTIPVSSGQTTITRSTCGSSSRATSQRCPSPPTPPDQTAAGSRPASRSPPACSAPAPPSGPPRPRRSRPHRSHDAHPSRSRDQPSWATATLHLPARLTVRGRSSGTTTQTDTSSQLNPGKSQGRPNEKHGLEAHRSKRPTRLRSPKEGPCPG